MQVDPVPSPDVTPAEREQQVLALFRLCLARDDISLDDDFFALGGDSLAATRILARLYDLWGADLQQDVLFRYSTPRALAHALDGDGLDSTLPASLVPLNDAPEGLPIYMIPGTSANPWTFQPLLEQAALQRPAYALRAPDLDWERDVLAVRELVQHYLTEIRRLQRRGPYSLAGYSFGGLLAFEIANRLIVDQQQVEHLIMFDTAGPPPWWRRATSPSRAATAALRRIGRSGALGGKLFDMLGWEPMRRAIFSYDTGPLTERELQSMAAVALPNFARRRDLRGLTVADLCHMIVEHWREALSDAEWEQATRHAPPDDAVALVKAHKIWAKNRWLGAAHQPRAVFPGTLTIYASETNRTVTAWQRFTSQPLDIRRVPTGRREKLAHASLLTSDNVALFVQDFKQLLESHG
jgi:thioesterase domain-containing protein/acyl carrier protein